MKTTFFLQIEPEFRRSYGDGEQILRAIQAKRVTQKRPRDPLPGCALVQLTIDIADAAFMPLRPVVEIVIPVDHTEAIKVVSDPVEVAG